MSHRTCIDADLDHALTHGGKMGRRIRDLSDTPLGPLGSWSPALRYAVVHALGSEEAIVILWGEDHITLYNDAYALLISSQHPSILGKPFFAHFPEAQAVFGPVFAQVLRTGQSQAFEDIPTHYVRTTFLEEVFARMTFQPIRDGGRVAGLSGLIIETTGRVVGDRRLATLQRLSLACANAVDAQEAGRLAADALAENAADLPGILLYLTEPRTHCVASRGLDPSCRAAMEADTSSWSFDDAARDEASVALTRLPMALRLESQKTDGQWPGPRGLVLPLHGRSGELRGYIVVVLSILRPFDERYHAFLELVAAHIGAAMERAESWLRAKQHAEQLAAADRAKTAFFSNISHELRTPLTLILNPLNDATMASGSLSGEPLRTAHRNAQRLLKLVNGLLDFARVESGRAGACLVPTDLAGLTVEVSSAFEAVAHQSGLEYSVSCDPLVGCVQVDPDMWEKIVLNLLSNAFKNTLRGSVELRLRATSPGVELTVSDTGIGISAADMPRIFERFARIETPQSRSVEGAGIGLSLTRELCRLHGGDVSVESREGGGSTFTVKLPLTAAPAIAGSNRPRLHAGGYVEEAMQWFDDGSADAEGGSVAPNAPQVLVVDDNPDMRAYLARLLGARWRVQVAGDGRAALRQARMQVPDIVVSDIMMPSADGLELLGSLRSDPQLQGVPVILLSARAGEEAAVEGLGVGADDYLAKPFSSRELVARVEAHLTLAAMRRRLLEQAQHAEELERAYRLSERLLEGSPVPMLLLQQGTKEAVAVNRAAREGLGGTTLETVLSTGSLTNSAHGGAVLPAARAVRSEELRDAPIVWSTNAGPRAGLLSSRAMPGLDGQPTQVAVALVDVTQLQRVEAKLRDALRARDEFLSVAMHEFRTPLVPIFLRAEVLKLKSAGLSAADATLRDALTQGLDDILRSASKLDALILDLLEMADIEGGNLSFKPQLSDLGQTLAEAFSGEAGGCPLRLRLDDGLVGLWDLRCLRKVVRHLMSNARKFGAGKPIDVTLKRVGDDAVLTVRDQGIGIAPQDQARVFNRLERAVSDRHYGGLGLGLWASRRLVNACGGSITLESELNAGTSVAVRLPFRRGEPA